MPPHERQPDRRLRILHQTPRAAAPVRDLRPLRPGPNVPAAPPPNREGGFARAAEPSALVPDGSDVTAGTKDGIYHADRPCLDLAEYDTVPGAALMARGVIDVRGDLQVTG